MTTKPDSSQVNFKPVSGPTVTVETALRTALASTGSAPIGGVTITNFVLNQSTPSDKVVFTDTAPGGWNTGPGRKTVDFEFVSTSYFSANPNGHVAIVTRCDTDVIASSVRGAGAIMGDLTSGFAGDELQWEPATVMESWSVPFIGGSRIIWPETPSPRNKILQDGTRYRWVIETTVQANTPGAYTRYRLYEYLAVKRAWRLLVDTGDVLDATTQSDMTKSGLVFGHAFASNLTAWNISFENIKVTWGPAGNVVTDTSTALSRYGAELEGDISFRQVGGRIRFPANAGPSLINSLTYQSSGANTATTLVFKPNGSSSTSNTIYSNNSTSDSAYQAASYGISGTEGLIETYVWGPGASPNLGINIGPGGRVATFKTTGLQMFAATKPIGQVLASYNNLTVFGGSNAVTHNTTNTLNIDSICGIGTLASFIGTPTGASIETVLRPLWCIVSELVAELRAKRVI